MEQVVIYSSGCPSCVEAEDILRKQGANPEVVNVDSTPGLRAEISQFLEMHGLEAKFPQIAIGTRLLGGLDKVKEYEASGELNRILTTPVKKGPCCRGLPEDQCSDTHRGMGKKKEEAHEHHAGEKEHVH